MDPAATWGIEKEKENEGVFGSSASNSPTLLEKNSLSSNTSLSSNLEIIQWISSHLIYILEKP